MYYRINSADRASGTPADFAVSFPSPLPAGTYSLATVLIPHTAPPIYSGLALVVSMAEAHLARGGSLRFWQRRKRGAEGSPEAAPARATARRPPGRASQASWRQRQGGQVPLQGAAGEWVNRE